MCTIEIYYGKKVLAGRTFENTVETDKNEGENGDE